jgi:hypothetical protein
MPPIRDDAAREERLAELIEEFRVRREPAYQLRERLDEVARLASELAFHPRWDAEHRATRARRARHNARSRNTS